MIKGKARNILHISLIYDLNIDIVEIEYNPASSNQDHEYICLMNKGDTAIDISGWHLTDAVEFMFEPGTVIIAGGTLYVSPDVAAFRQRAAKRYLIIWHRWAEAVQPRGQMGHDDGRNVTRS